VSTCTSDDCDTGCRSVLGRWSELDKVLSWLRIPFLTGHKRLHPTAQRSLFRPSCLHFRAPLASGGRGGSFGLMQRELSTSCLHWTMMHHGLGYRSLKTETSAPSTPSEDTPIAPAQATLRRATAGRPLRDVVLPPWTWPCAHHVSWAPAPVAFDASFLEHRVVF
jgi:hypothetical protein